MATMADDRKEEIKVASNKKSTAKDKPAKGTTIKLKKPPPKQSKPGEWKNNNVLEDKKPKVSPAASTAPSPGPVVNQLDEFARETFATGHPLEDPPALKTCKHCKKSILLSAAKAHIAGCLKIKKEKAQRKKEAREMRERQREKAAREAREEEGGGETASDGEEDGEKKVNGGKTTKKVGGKKNDTGDMKGKKRKAEGDPDKGPKQKKKKDEPKAKLPKPKGPVDVERQCGVINPSTGQPCARSLTCKSHSMGAKRSVAGRSLPYDMLLAAYQKKNQAKQQKAALDANAPLEDDDELGAGPVDSDEETAAVMSALAKWKPQPVVPQPVFTPIKRRYQQARLEEQLRTATNGGRVNIFKVVGYGAQTLPPGQPGLMDNEDAPGEPDNADIIMGGMSSSRRSSTFGVNGQPQRKSSVGIGHA